MEQWRQDLPVSLLHTGGIETGTEYAICQRQVEEIKTRRKEAQRDGHHTTCIKRIKYCNV